MIFATKEGFGVGLTLSTGPHKEDFRGTNDGRIKTQGDPRAHALPFLGGVRVLPPRNGLHGVAPVANARHLPGMSLGRKTLLGSSPLLCRLTLDLFPPPATFSSSDTSLTCPSRTPACLFSIPTRTTGGARPRPWLNNLAVVGLRMERVSGNTGTNQCTT